MYERKTKKRKVENKEEKNSPRKLTQDSGMEKNHSFKEMRVTLVVLSLLQAQREQPYFLEIQRGSVDLNAGRIVIRYQVSPTICSKAMLHCNFIFSS